MSIFDSITAKIDEARSEGREVLLVTEELLKHLANEIDVLAGKVAPTATPATQAPAADATPTTPAAAAAQAV